MSALTDERVEGYMQLIQRATAGFEDRLQRIDGRLEILADLAAASTGANNAEAAMEVHQIQEDRANTERYLAICTQLMSHINELRLAGRRDPDSTSADSVSEKIANEGFDECADSISRMASRLATHEQQLFKRLSDAMMSSAPSTMDGAEISRLRSEWKSTHAQMDILSKAERKLKETVSIINNRATGNAIQVMVSVDGKPIHGTNEGTGEWTRQVGGYMSNESLQQVMQGMLKMSMCDLEKSKLGKENSVPEHVVEKKKSESTFESVYGGGNTLGSESKPPR